MCVQRVLSKGAVDVDGLRDAAAFRCVAAVDGAGGGGGPRPVGGGRPACAVRAFRPSRHGRTISGLFEGRRARRAGLDGVGVPGLNQDPI